VGPLALSALLYLGAFVALVPLRNRREAPLKRADAPVLAAMAAAGALVGPALMLVGLARVSGVAGALLLTLQAPMTMAIAVAFFGDHLGGRAALGGALVVAGAGLLAWRPGGLSADLLGVAAMAGVGLAWVFDDNFAQ